MHKTKAILLCKRLTETAIIPANKLLFLSIKVTDEFWSLTGIQIEYLSEEITESPDI